MYVCKYTCMYVYIYIYIHIYTLLFAFMCSMENRQNPSPPPQGEETAKATTYTTESALL